jgi:hypothetical protein
VGIGSGDALLQGRLPSQEWRKDAFTGQGANFWHSGLYLAGTPGAGSLPGAGVNGAQVVNGRSGTLLAPAALAGKACYLNVADFSAASGVASAFLIDRLWENSALSVTSTGAQAIVPVALPARDRNLSALGVGVGIALEVTASLGAATGTVTLLYTDSDGNAGASSVITVPTSCVAGTMIPFPLAAGDYGVRVPTQVTNSVSFLSGSYSLVMYLRWGRKLRASTISPPDFFGPADGGHGIPDGAAPQFVYILTGSAVGLTDGTVEFVQA